MSCFFCDSLTHVSHFCDIYICNKSRMENARSKSCCQICLTELSEYHDDLCCFNCKDNKKCVICLSQNHHSVFCSDRDVSCFFIPNIDKDLFPRFIGLLNFEEKYSMAFLSPLTLELINPKHLTIVEELRGENIEVGSNFIVTKRFRYRPPPLSFGKMRLPSLSSIIFKCAEIYLRAMNLSQQELLQLLSVKVRHIECVHVTLLPKLKFSDIIKAAPNFEYFNFCYINVVTGKSWPEDILKWKNGKNLQMLKIEIQNIYFDVRSLIEVIEEKCANRVEIFLDINFGYDRYWGSDLIGECQRTFEKIEDRMLPYFSGGKNSYGRAFVKISFTYDKKPISFSYEPFFTLR